MGRIFSPFFWVSGGMCLYPVSPNVHRCLILGCLPVQDLNGVLFLSVVVRL